MPDIYVQITNEPVVKTDCHSDSTLNVDLDRNGVPVGVEVVGALSVTVDGEVCRCAPTPAATPARTSDDGPINVVAEGGTNPLSPCEVITLQMLAAGLTTKQIATREHVGGSAVTNRMSRAARKLGTTTATNTVLVAYRRGYLSDPTRR